MKSCPRCQQEKPIEQFYAVHRSWCVDCEREDARWRMARYENKVRLAWRAAKRSAERFGVEDTLTPDEVAYIFALAGHRCAYTGKYSDKLTLEHIVPMSRGGANAVWNIVAVDASLNHSKQDVDPSEWLWLRGQHAVEADLVLLMASRKGVSELEMMIELEEFQKAYNAEWYENLMKRSC